MKDICKTCKKEFKNRCHAHRKYCSFKCQKNGEWYKEMKKVHLGKSSWNKGKPNTWTKKTIFHYCTDCGKELKNQYAIRCSVCYHKTKDFEDYKKMGLKGLIKQQNSKEPTSIEKIVYDYLRLKGVKFNSQMLINGHFLVDAYIPASHLVIECDGDYWHSLDRVVKKDKAENAYLIKCGFNLLRLPEHEIRSGIFKERMVI